MHGQKQAPLIRAKLRYRKEHLAWIALIAFLFWLCYLGIQDALAPKYIDIPSLFPVVFFAGAAVYIVYIIFMVNTLLVYPERLVVKSIFGYVKKVILLPQLTGYTEEEKYSEGNTYSYKHLTIYTPKTSYGIYSFQYSNYRDIRAALTHYAKPEPQRLALRYKRSKLVKIPLLGMAAIACLYFAFYLYIHRNEDRQVAPVTLTTISGRLAAKPEITKYKRRSSIHISLQGVPQFDFVIGNDAYKSTDASAYLANVKKGDKVWLGITKSDYHTKIKEDEPLSFWQKHSHYEHIAVYSLSDRNQWYLRTENYNAQVVGERDSFLIWGVLAIAAFVIYTMVEEVREYLKY